jgi:hypothetical protein
MNRSAWATEGVLEPSAAGFSPSLASLTALGFSSIFGDSACLIPLATVILTSISGRIRASSQASRELFFAGVEGVVDSFLDGGEEGLAGAVEPEEVAVLGEELRDGDFALFLGHVLRADAVDDGGLLDFLEFGSRDFLLGRRRTSHGFPLLPGWTGFGWLLLQNRPTVSKVPGGVPVSAGPLSAGIIPSGGKKARRPRNTLFMY